MQRSVIPTFLCFSLFVSCSMNASAPRPPPRAWLYPFHLICISVPTLLPLLSPHLSSIAAHDTNSWCHMQKLKRRSLPTPFVSLIRLPHPPDECHGSRAFRTLSLLLWFSVSGGSSGNVLVKRFNNVSSVCTPNTCLLGIMGDIDLGVGERRGRQNLCYLNFKPPAFYFVNCSNKELLQKAVF